MTVILFNPLSDNRHGEQNAKKITEHLKDEELKFVDITTLDIGEYLSSAPAEDKIIIAGGDGTVHRIINELDGKAPLHSLYYFPTGCGNDFKTDIKDKNSDDIILLNDYIKDLPVVSVDGGKKIRFFNGIGFGIDGYCCEEGDKLKKQTDKPINYAAIAIKGMLKYFKPRNAVVTVDGEKREYKYVWLAASMNGRFYGGGMNIAPVQDRLNAERKLTVVVFHCKSKLRTLMVFPSIFKGKHIEHKKMVDVIQGGNITVEFDRPTPLQVDGETYLNIKSYSVLSARELDKAQETIKSAE